MIAFFGWIGYNCKVKNKINAIKGENYGKRMCNHGRR